MAQKVELLILNAEKRKENEGLVVVSSTCPECGKPHFLGMTLNDFRAYAAERMADEIFPDEPADIRELLITGICSECWDKLFPKEEQYFFYIKYKFNLFFINLFVNFIEK